VPHRHRLTAIAAALVLAAAPSALAQTIDFGDDASHWANDGECDDPRFAGPGSAATLDPWDLGHDATDCQALLDSGDVEYVARGGKRGEKAGVSDGPAGADADATADIDFGDDSGGWPTDGECDDPRFTGPGMAAEPFLSETNIAADATDCRALFESGDIALSDPDAGESAADPSAGATAAADIDFGDDEGGFANDGECDDPRFEGAGASMGFSSHEKHDASDCRSLFESGEVRLSGEKSSPGPANTTPAGDIDFGDDTSSWANDGECDDPRFEGPGAAAVLLDGDLGHDATDCRALYESGEVSLSDESAAGAAPDGDTATGESAADETTDPADAVEEEAPAAPANASDIEFGDDSGDWPNDEECDDPRFEGEGMAYGPTLMENNIGGDASDCRALFEAGEITLVQ